MHLYLGCPACLYPGDLGSISEVFAEESRGLGWVIRLRTYDSRSSINANDFYSMVMQRPGPVLLMKPIQTNASVQIRTKLVGKVPIEVKEVTSVQDLMLARDSLWEKFTSGEPFIALDLVVALLLLKKLDKQRMWAGNSKGYMWADDIPKGRGVDVMYVARIPVVLTILLQRGLLVQKKSMTSKKYALNPEKRVEIYDIIRTHEFPESINKVLLGHGEVASSRVLDQFDDYLEGE